MALCKYAAYRVVTGHVITKPRNYVVITKRNYDVS